MSSEPLSIQGQLAQAVAAADFYYNSYPTIRLLIEANLLMANSIEKLQARVESLELRMKTTNAEVKELERRIKEIDGRTAGQIHPLTTGYVGFGPGKKSGGG